MDLTPKITITPGWSIFSCCTPAISNDNDENDDGYDGFLWSAPSIKVVTLGGSKDFFAGQAAETPTTACSDDTDDCYSFNLQGSPPPSKTTAVVEQSEAGVPQTTTNDTSDTPTSKSSVEQPSTPFIGVEIVTPKSRKLKEGYAVKRTSKFNRSTTEEGSVTSEDDDDDDISDQDDELTYLYPNKNHLDENQSPVKSDASNGGTNKANDVIELPIDAPKLGLFHYFKRSAFSDITNKDKGAEEDETSDEDKFYDSLESLGDESDDDCSTNSSNRKNEFRTMTTRELQFADTSFEVIPSLKKNDDGF